MGHFMKATIPGQKEPVAELNIFGIKRRQTKIYTALKVEAFNRLDSGSGDTAFFTRRELNEAAYYPDLTNEERQFILLCAEKTLAQGLQINFS